MSPALDYALIADLYDEMVRFEADLPFFLEECRTAEGPVLELMCGTGRVSLPLIEAGIELTCVDSSRQMLTVLRRKLGDRGLSADLVCQDVTRLDLERRYDLALLPFHSFEELATAADQRAALAAIRSALTPHGRFVCTLHNPRVRRRSLCGGPETVMRNRVGDGELSVAMDLEYDPCSGEVRGIEIVEKRGVAGEILARRELAIRYALIEESTFRRLAQEAGFTIERLFGDYDRSAFDADGSPYSIWRLGRIAPAG